MSVNKTWWGEHRGGITWAKFVASGVRILSVQAGANMGLLTKCSTTISRDDQRIAYYMFHPFTRSIIISINHSLYRFVGKLRVEKKKKKKETMEKRKKRGHTRTKKNEKTAKLDPTDANDGSKDAKKEETKTLVPNDYDDEMPALDSESPEEVIYRWQRHKGIAEHLNELADAAERFADAAVANAIIVLTDAAAKVQAASFAKARVAIEYEHATRAAKYYGLD